MDNASLSLALVVSVMAMLRQQSDKGGVTGVIFPRGGNSCLLVTGAVTDKALAGSGCWQPLPTPHAV